MLFSPPACRLRMSLLLLSSPRLHRGRVDGCLPAVSPLAFFVLRKVGPMTPINEVIEAQAARGSLWRNRDYLLLWCGQTISALGNNVSDLAFPLLVLATTGSPAQAGLVAALEALAGALVMLPAGALVDRWDRKRVMLCCDLCRFLSLVSIPLALMLGHLTIYQLAFAALI